MPRTTGFRYAFSRAFGFQGTCVMYIACLFVQDVTSLRFCMFVYFELLKHGYYSSFLFKVKIFERAERVLNVDSIVWHLFSACVHLSHVSR